MENVLHTLNVVSLSAQYFAPRANLVPAVPDTQLTWTAVSSLSLILWKTDPKNSEPSLLQQEKHSHAAKQPTGQKGQTDNKCRINVSWAIF